MGKLEITEKEIKLESLYQDFIENGLLEKALKVVSDDGTVSLREFRAKVNGKTQNYCDVVSNNFKLLGMTCSGSNCATCKQYLIYKLMDNHNKYFSSNSKKVEEKTSCNYWKMPNTINTYIAGCSNEIIYNTGYEFCPKCGKKINIKGDYIKNERDS